jgi:hypothetical protein
MQIELKAVLEKLAKGLDELDERLTRLEQFLIDAYDQEKGEKKCRSLRKKS